MVRSDVDDAADTFEYYGGLANKITGEVNPIAPKALDFTIKNPSAFAGKSFRGIFRLQQKPITWH